MKEKSKYILHVADEKPAKGTATSQGPRRSAMQVMANSVCPLSLTVLSLVAMDQRNVQLPDTLSTAAGRDVVGTIPIILGIVR